MATPPPKSPPPRTEPPKKPPPKRERRPPPKVDAGGGKTWGSGGQIISGTVGIPETDKTAGIIGGKDVVMRAHVPEGIQDIRKSIHATQPTILIHGKTPSDYGQGVVRYSDSNLISTALQKAESKVAIIQEEATLPQKVELSAISRGVYDVSVIGADFLRRTKLEHIPTTKPIVSEIVSTVIESGARTVEMVGMLPGGVETLAQHPELVEPSLAVGLYGTTVGFGKAFIEDPFQTLSDVAVMGSVFRGVGKITPRAKLPYTISRKSTVPKGVLLKGEIKAPKVDIKTTTTKAVTEYKPPKVETFVGKVKGDVADLYVKVPESEIGMLKTITSETAPYQVMTGEGKFTVIDKPTYLDVQTPTTLKLPGETKLTLREQLAAQVPYEVISKVDLTQVRLQSSIVSERVMIPEFLRTIDVTPTQTRAGTFEFADAMKTKGLLESGKIGEFKDFTEPFRRKDIQEIPYTRDISIGILEESALLGRVLLKQERGLVRDTIIKERIEFEPVKTQYTPPRTDFSTVGSVTGQQFVMKSKAAPTTFKEPSTIQTINLETDLRMPDTMAQVATKIKTAPTTFKEPSTIQTINLETDLRMPDTMAQVATKIKTAPTTFKEPVDFKTFDVEAMFKRSTYEQMLAGTKAKVIGKPSAKTRKQFRTAVIPRSRTINVVGSAHGQIPDTKRDLVANIGIPSAPTPFTRPGTMFDSVVDTKPITETEAILYKPPPTAKVVFDYPPIKPIVIPPRKKDKKDEKEKRTQKVKGFQYFIKNPIASPFGNSVGKVNK